ncbi:uncharacterized protein ACA1_393020 [Acanthamoeba castellanii str. Neff]|uniref:Uncharacterized protein n=1 Tax=Acanthamoeba castellanii (strain ATCC 30010 / Neff) TaxID=1257118 RepID=L8H2Q6_ACACF|nr:uncharacterized protein ACA1_393020 [Acanthamoeba castellanii str. Neff]ELR18656.1 hypothetical protein ACA1_393020 [Acanthamoeba castellanii str. Neff]
MQTTKFVVFALLVCLFFVAAAFAQNANRPGQNAETDFEFNQNHFNGIKNAVREGSRGGDSRGSGRDVDIDIDIQHLKIEFEKNFFILIKKGY